MHGSTAAQAHDLRPVLPPPENSGQLHAPNPILVPPASHPHSPSPTSPAALIRQYCSCLQRPRVSQQVLCVPATPVVSRPSVQIEESFYEKGGGEQTEA